MDIQALPPNASPSASASVREPDFEQTEGFEEELMLWMGEQPPEVSWVERALAAEDLSELAALANGQMETNAPNLEAMAQPITGWDSVAGLGDGVSGTDAWAPGRAAQLADPAQVSEQHRNVHKLVRYLQHSGPAETPSSIAPASSSEVDPDPTMKLVIADEPQAPTNAPRPEPSTPQAKSAHKEAARPAFGSALSEAGPAEASFQESSSSFSDSEGAGSNPMLAYAQDTNPAQAQHASQLGASARRLIADARVRSWGPAAKVPLELQLDEATVPMRLKFSPRGDGSHEVRFVVATPRDRRELRRQMPELESALAELPVQIADVRVEVDTERVPAGHTAPNRSTR